MPTQGYEPGDGDGDDEGERASDAPRGKSANIWRINKTTFFFLPARTPRGAQIFSPVDF